MRRFKSLFGLLAFLLVFASFGAGAGAVNGNGANKQAGKLAHLVGSYDLSSSSKTNVIVELTEPSLVEAKHTGKSQSKQKLTGFRNQVIADVDKAIDGVAVQRQYDYVFSGFSLELSEM